MSAISPSLLAALIGDKSVLCFHVPDGYKPALASLNIAEKAPTQAVLAFVHELPAMLTAVLDAEKALEDGGILYLAYPKLKNGLGLPGIHRDSIFPHLRVDESTGYVHGTLMRFNMMRALDQDYTLLCVKKDASAKARPPVSSKVADYASRVPELKAALKGKPCLAFFSSLSPGYQRAWARYVFSAKTEATKLKRLDHMAQSLDQGLKTP